MHERLVFSLVELTDTTALQIPASWSSAQRRSERLGIDFHVAVASSRSPSCLPGEPVSTDPDVACNVYDGRLLFHGVDPTAPEEGRPPGSDFTATVGWWSW